MLPTDPGQQVSSVRGPEEGLHGDNGPRGLRTWRSKQTGRGGGHAAAPPLRADTLDFTSHFKS